MVAIEAHQSNGRIERVTRMIRDGLCKLCGGLLEDKINRIVDKYNETYHAGIKFSPIEAIEESRREAVIENSREGAYAKRVKQFIQHEIRKGDKIRFTMKDEEKD